MLTALVSSFLDLVRVIRRHRGLVLALTKDELLRPFAGSVIGLAWAVLHPIALMVLYLVVFAFVFKLRLSGMGAGSDYTVYLLAGLLSWMAWATVINTSSGTIVNNASLVRQAQFPSEILPLRAVLASLVPQVVGMTVVLLYVVVRFRTLPWTVLLLPAAVLLQAVSMLGAAYLLSAVAVFARDVKEVAAVFVTAGIFIVPAFYTPTLIEKLHPAARLVIEGNPFTLFINIFRDCLLWGGIAHPWSWGVATVAGLLFVTVSYRVFRRLRVFFGNFL